MTSLRLQWTGTYCYISLLLVKLLLDIVYMSIHSYHFQLLHSYIPHATSFFHCKLCLDRQIKWHFPCFKVVPNEGVIRIWKYPPLYLLQGLLLSNASYSFIRDHFEKSVIQFIYPNIIDKEKYVFMEQALQICPNEKP